MCPVRQPRNEGGGKKGPPDLGRTGQVSRIALVLVPSRKRKNRSRVPLENIEHSGRAIEVEDQGNAA